MNRLGAVYMMTAYVGLGMGAAASAQTSEPFLFGTTLRSIPNATSSLGEGNPIPVDGRYWFADIPMAENMFPIVDDRLFVTTNLNFTFGTSPDFSFVPTVGPGLRWYPVRFISLYSQGRLGTLTFSSYTLLANVGIDVNIPVGESAVLVVGAEYFNRRVRELAGFIDGEQWYISGDGIGFRLGILWRE